MPATAPTPTIADLLGGNNRGSRANQDALSAGLMELLQDPNANPFDIANALSVPLTMKDRNRAGLGGDMAVQALLGKAFEHGASADARRDSVLGVLMGDLARQRQDFEDQQRGLNQNLFAGAADRAMAGQVQAMRGLRGALGASGIGAGSGAALGIAGNLNLQRLGQITGAKRDVAIQSANRRFQFNNQRFQQLFGIQTGPGLMSDNMVPLDALSSLVMRQDQKHLGLKGLRQADKAAQAQATAGAISGATSLLGALL